MAVLLGGGTNTNYKLDLVRNSGPLMTDTGSSATYTATDDTAYSGIRIVIYSGTTCNNLTFRPMLELGSTATAYVPHQEQTQQLRLGDIELAKIGTYVDRIFEAVEGNSVYDSLSDETKASLTSGGWYIEKQIGHKKASEIIENNIGLVAQGTSIYNTGVKSDRTLQVYSNVQTWKNTTDTEWNTLNGNYIGILYNVSQIYINKTASVRSEILTWLNSINFEMYYVLSTPTYEEITNETLIEELNELEKMMSYSGQTNISVSGNLPMIINVSALKGE